MDQLQIKIWGAYRGALLEVGQKVCYLPISILTKAATGWVASSVHYGELCQQWTTWFQESAEV